MPKIPYVTSEVVPSGSSGGFPVSPETAAAPYIAQAKVGKELEEASNKAIYLNQLYEEKKREAQIASEISKVKVELEKDGIAALETFNTDPDFPRYGEKWEEIRQGNSQKYESMITDPEAKRKLAPYIELKQLEYGHRIRNLSDTRRKEKYVADWVDSGPVYADLYARTGDDQYIQQFVNTTKELIGAGIITGIQAETQIHKVAVGGDLTRAKKIIDKNPDGWFDIEDRRKMFPYLTEDNFVTLDEHAEIKSRSEGSRIDRLTRATQLKNRSDLLDDYAAGNLDLLKLQKYRERDPDTGRPGISDEVYLYWLDRLKSGKDVITDPKVFSDLYVKQGLTQEDVDKNADKLSPADQRILLGHVWHEKQTIEAEIRQQRRQRELEIDREQRDIKRKGEQEENRVRAAAKDVRNKYYGDAKSLINKAFTAAKTKSEDRMAILKAFDAYYSDPNVKSEELPDLAMQLLKPIVTSNWTKFWSWIKGEATPEDIAKMEQESMYGGAFVGEPAPAKETEKAPQLPPAGQMSREEQQRRAKEIFGVK